MRFLERALLACSMLLERSEKERARGRKRGGLGEKKREKEEEPAIIFFNTSCRPLFPKCVNMSKCQTFHCHSNVYETILYTRNVNHYVLKGANHRELLSVGVARRCQVCEHLTIGESFESTNTKKAYSIMYELNCNSSNVVYFLCCKVCDI